MILNKEQIIQACDNNQDVYAYQFITADKKSGRRISHLPPTRGKIIEYHYGHVFCPYGKRGNLNKSKIRRLSYYFNMNLEPIICDDKETAVKNYNNLIDKEIKIHKEQILELEKLKENTNGK